ncbi:MAG: YceI family protein [Polyangiaceae bacterium]|nr:YceI family protein [Polyangiaceae bacterium]NUQ91377.1 YceI family protein [Gemmatimonadaceae bacterium]
MRSPITHAFAAALVLVPIRIAPEQLAVQPQSRMWIEGTSTIRSFQCSVPEFTLTVDAEGIGAVTAVLGGQKAVRTVQLTVPATRMDCGNGRMNEHMLKTVKAEENPTIRFTLASYDVAKAGDGVQGTLRGTLTLGGATHPIDVNAVATDAGNGAMRIVGGYEVALSAFDLERPSLMFGRIKVGDKIQVKFDLVLKS